MLYAISVTATFDTEAHALAVLTKEPTAIVDGVEALVDARYATAAERTVVLDWFIAKSAWIVSGRMGTHDCYHDEGGSCGEETVTTWE